MVTRRNRIAYVGGLVLWVMDSDGVNQRQLTKVNNDNHPTWSPDSESIAFHSVLRDFVRRIYVVDVTNGAVDALPSDPHVPELRSGLAISRRTLGFAEGEPDYKLGQVEECRVETAVRGALGRWQLTSLNCDYGIVLIVRG